MDSLSPVVELVGIIAGYLTSQLIGWFDSDPILDIGLTSVLAYLSFLIAEELLHVSGIMATLGAGLTIGTWGRLRIASSVRAYLEQFWGTLAFGANSLLFLLLGLQVNLLELASVWDLVLWVILAMLVSRALVVFALLPLVSRLFKVEPIGAGYRFIMFWGGLRGAIALAIVLSLPEYPFKDLFIALVTGAVLFTLLVQGLTIKPAMRMMKLDLPPMVDQLALIERNMLTHQRALQRMPELQKGGLFSSRVAHRLSLNSHQAITLAKEQIDQLRLQQLTQDEELNLFFLRALAEEKAYYIDMYDRGHLSESTARRLLAILELQTDTLRYENGFHRVNNHHRYEYIEHWLFRLLDNKTLLRGIVERLRVSHIGHYYETAWGHFQGSNHIIHSLERIMGLESTPPEIIHQVLQQYRDWNTLAVNKLYRLNHDFPEIALLTQERLGKRIVLLAELETTREQARLGTIPKGQAEDIEADVDRRLNSLRGQPIQKLKDDPELFLARVPLFANLPPRLIQLIAQKCEVITLEKAQTPSRLYTLSRSELQNLMSLDAELRELIMHSDAQQKNLHFRHLLEL